jgi:dTDP-4-dehydrorhamnose reductase
MTSSPRQKVLITGAAGQVGSELRQTAPAEYEVVACSSSELDITDARRVQEVLGQAHPDVVINAAAYTRVDEAEREVDRAMAVNADGARNLARTADKLGVRLIHLSTDFVFDGSQGHPYAPEDRPAPLGAYGRTKLLGEQMVLECAPNSTLIVRTAWVYSSRGQNFVHTMLRVMREDESVGVVCDQVGTPTWGRGLAQALWRGAARPELRGILHWTDAGVASWFDFAVAIQEESLALGLLNRIVPIRPLRSDEYRAQAQRPRFSVLDKSTGWAALGGPAPHWRANLRCMLQGLASA